MKGNNASGKRFLWCLECGRCYAEGECRWESLIQWSEEEMEYLRSQGLGDANEPLELCPYDGCDGDVFGHGIDWEVIRKAHPEYPVIPKRCKVYEW